MAGTDRTNLQAQWRIAAGAALATTHDPSAVIALAEQLLAVAPLDEPALGAWLNAEQAMGRPGRARQMFENYAQRLAADWQLEPSAALRTLVEPATLVRSALLPAARPAATAAGGAPVAGVDAAAPDLESAEIGAAGFVGRRSELTELRTMLSRPDCRLLAQADRHGAAAEALREAVRLTRAHGMQAELTMVMRSWVALPEARGQPLPAASVLLAAIAQPATTPTDATLYKQLLDALSLGPRARRSRGHGAGNERAAEGHPRRHRRRRHRSRRGGQPARLTPSRGILDD